MASRSREAKKKNEDGVWDTVKLVLQALLIAFIIRTFFFQPFNIPSGSMIPTLRIGDFLFVNKLSYGYGPYSFDMSLNPFSSESMRVGPFDFSGRYFAAMPERGDVVVFKLPTNTRIDYIKRIVGLPGDTIQVTNGILYINGTAVKRERIEDFVNHDDNADPRPIKQFRETLPNGVSYNTLDSIDGSLEDNTEPYVVPAGHYFMMGDNRDNSQDSRFLRVVGYVPYENLVGRATMLFFSHEPDVSFWQIWRWPTGIRWNRLFNWVG